MAVPVVKYVHYFCLSAWESKQTIFFFSLVMSKCWSMTLQCSKEKSLLDFQIPALGKGGLADANENIHLIPPVILRLHEDVFSSYKFKSLNTGIRSFEQSGLLSAEKKAWTL